MGFFTMPQLILSAAIGGSNAEVFCVKQLSGCGNGPQGSIEVPQSLRKKAVHRFLHG